jgi:hypothetical protein
LHAASTRQTIELEAGARQKENPAGFGLGLNHRVMACQGGMQVGVISPHEEDTIRT